MAEVAKKFKRGCEIFFQSPLNPRIVWNNTCLKYGDRSERKGLVHVNDMAKRDMEKIHRKILKPKDILKIKIIDLNGMLDERRKRQGFVDSSIQPGSNEDLH